MERSLSALLTLFTSSGGGSYGPVRTVQLPAPPAVLALTARCKGSWMAAPISQGFCWHRGYASFHL